jgi:hypothetical protein
MWDLPAGHPLKRMFAGLTEHAFVTKLGVADPTLVDYLSNMLARFVHADDVYRLRGGDGRPLTNLVGMVVEAETLPGGGRTRREYFRHIGDFTLFWTGVYPEAVTRARRQGDPDGVVNFTTQGKRAYRIAGEFDDARFANEAPVLRRLAEEFELCAVGLREVRHEWEEMQQHPGVPGRLIR